MKWRCNTSANDAATVAGGSWWQRKSDATVKGGAAQRGFVWLQWSEVGGDSGGSSGERERERERERKKEERVAEVQGRRRGFPKLKPQINPMALVPLTTEAIYPFLASGLAGLRSNT